MDEPEVVGTFHRNRLGGRKKYTARTSGKESSRGRREPTAKRREITFGHAKLRLLVPEEPTVHDPTNGRGWNERGGEGVLPKSAHLRRVVAEPARCRERG